ncbi:1-aminocyclopropane-1-carboxylate deaminase [Blastomyces dermatitidis ATCC 18188]|uniref:1-aminocyclopropane-1-carboxylate deaminase n=1 Tax=Ajellomyces dermatitidis (strain ATCC 18188 / CBS 674.68) TaxID=653446 RepID=F2TN43_AJEDA|nr:1-aminocyclopropane-1-carboxylate deaminase [Blastomyces dermatitidis ATCC 18188]
MCVLTSPVSASSISPSRWGWWRSVETVIVCAVTGSTVAGMVAGFKLIEKLYPEEEAKKGVHGGKRRKVVGIDASAKPAETRAQVLRIAKDTAEKIGLGAEQITEEDIVLDERYHAGVYGIPDKQTWDMVRRGKISSGTTHIMVNISIPIRDFLNIEVLKHIAHSLDPEKRRHQSSSSPLFLHSERTS